MGHSWQCQSGQAGHGASQVEEEAHHRCAPTRIGFGYQQQCTRLKYIMRSVPATICRRSSCLHTTSTHGCWQAHRLDAAPGLHSAAQPGCTLSKQEHAVPRRCGQRATWRTPTPDRCAGTAGSRACPWQACTPRDGGSSAPSTGRRGIGDPSATQTDGSDRSDGPEGPGGPCAADPHRMPGAPAVQRPPPQQLRDGVRCAAAAAATGFASSRHWCGWPGR
jgi:hypothetical protein